MEREGLEMVDLLKTLERSRHHVQKKPSIADLHVLPVTEESIEQTWMEIRKIENSPKERKKWRQVQLDDFEADLARYALIALQHHAHEFLSRKRAQEPPRSDSRLIDADPRQPDKEKAPEDGCDTYGTSWEIFAALQSNEVKQIKAFPELLLNHIRIYQVLKGVFGSGSPSGPSSHLGNGPNRAGGDGTKDALKGESEDQGLVEELENSVTIENVRLALGVEVGNSFRIWETPLTEESECLGFSVYPTPSLFNHSECGVSGKGREE